MNFAVSFNGNQRDWSNHVVESRLNLLIQVYNRPDPSTLSLIGRIFEFVKVQFLNFRFWLTFGSEENAYRILEQLSRQDLQSAELLNLFNTQMRYFPVQHRQQLIYNYVPGAVGVSPSFNPAPVRNVFPSVHTRAPVVVPETCQVRRNENETTIYVGNESKTRKRNGPSARVGVAPAPAPKHVPQQVVYQPAPARVQPAPVQTVRVPANKPAPQSGVDHSVRVSSGDTTGHRSGASAHVPASSTGSTPAFQNRR